MATRSLVAATFAAALSFPGVHATLAETPETWLEIKAPPIIAPGTALDFSAFRPSGNVPAGTFGSVVARGEHFEFEKLPGVPQRFYGMNTTGSMNLPDYEDAVCFAGNAARLGYNAIRIHHHDDELTRSSPDGTTLNPDEMRKLDAIRHASLPVDAIGVRDLERIYLQLSGALSAAGCRAF